MNATVGIIEDIIWQPGVESLDLPCAVLVSCREYNGPMQWQTEPQQGFPQGILIVSVVPMKTFFES